MNPREYFSSNFGIIQSNSECHNQCFAPTLFGIIHIAAKQSITRLPQSSECTGEHRRLRSQSYHFDSPLEGFMSAFNVTARHLIEPDVVNTRSTQLSASFIQL